MSSARQSRSRESKIRLDKISDIYGQKVYSKKGVYLGTVTDVKLDFSEADAVGIALTDVNQDLKEATENNRNGVVIPYKWVESVHDVVLTIDVVQRLDY